MASIIAHICISNMVKEELRLSDKFLVGSVIPDLKKIEGIDENITHYLKYQISDDGNVMHLPNLEKFIEANTFKLLDFKTLGYYSHLIEDKIWFEQFIGKYIKWHDENLGLVTNIKTGKVYDYEIFKNEIHSDYLNTNNIILSKYNLNLENMIKEIKDNLKDDVLSSALDKDIYINTQKPNTSKRYFLTDDDLKEYISTAEKEVIKRINELR